MFEDTSIEHAMTYRKRLVQFAKNYTGDVRTAEDIVSECLFTYWKKAQDFHVSKAMLGFLFISVKNTCINYRIKRGRQIANFKAVEATLDTWEECHLSVIEHKEVLREILFLIDYLPRQCKKIS